MKLQRKASHAVSDISGMIPPGASAQDVLLGYTQRYSDEVLKRYPLSMAGAEGLREGLFLPNPGYRPVQRLHGVEIASRILDEAVRRYHDKSFSDAEVLVYFDPDVDGLIAGRFFVEVLMRRGVRPRYVANSNREHGFKLDVSSLAPGSTVFCGDFLVEDEVVSSLVQRGISVLSVDHHECQPDFIHHTSTLVSPVNPSGSFVAEGVVINNQYPWEDSGNRFQSGAGVTFECLREIDVKLDTADNRALVGISLLTDIRDIEQVGARAWLWELYHHCKQSKFLRYLLDATVTFSNGYGLPVFDNSCVTFSFSPAVNSLFRFNREMDAIRFILGGGYPSTGLVRDNKSLTFQKLGTEFREQVFSTAVIEDYGSLYVVSISETDFTEVEAEYVSNFVGLICSRLSGEGKSALGYCTNALGEVTRASFRGNNPTGRYREELVRQLGLDGRGHSVAFGVVGLQPSVDLFERVSAVCQQVDAGDSYRVPYVTVYDLEDFMSSAGYKIADYNQYVLSQNRIRVRFVGECYQAVAKDNFQLYRLSNTSRRSLAVIRGFLSAYQQGLDPSNALLEVSLENGQVALTVSSRFEDDSSRELSSEELSKILSVTW